MRALENKKNRTLKHLSHYWPLNTNTKDIIRRHDMKCDNKPDKMNRFAKLNSALYLNRDFCNLTDGVYIKGEFTFMLWIKISELMKGKRFSILDIENRDENMSNRNKIELGVDNRNFSIHYYENNTDRDRKIELNVDIAYDKWFNLAYILDNKHFWIYLNGSLAASYNDTLELPKNSTRDSRYSYIGKSNYATVEAITAYLSDIRIYSAVLNSKQIKEEMNGRSTILLT
jgi:hypothetical protein